MSFTQHFATISQVFSHFMHNFSFQQCEYCEIGNVSVGPSKSCILKFLTNHLSSTHDLTRFFLAFVIWNNPGAQYDSHILENYKTELSLYKVLVKVKFTLYKVLRKTHVHAL